MAIVDIAERILVIRQNDDLTDGENWTSEFLPINLLRPGFMLESDIILPNGHLILGRGVALTDAHIHRIKGIHTTKRVVEPIKVAYLQHSDTD